MNYYQAIIAKATGIEPGPDQTDIIIAMDCRFSALTEKQIASKAKRAWREVQEVRAMFPQPKNVTGTSQKAVA